MHEGRIRLLVIRRRTKTILREDRNDNDNCLWFTSKFNCLQNWIHYGLNINSLRMRDFIAVLIAVCCSSYKKCCGCVWVVVCVCVCGREQQNVLQFTICWAFRVFILFSIFFLFNFFFYIKYPATSFNYHSLHQR